MQAFSVFWKKWTLYCAAGELLGIGAAGVIAYWVNSRIGEPQGLAEKMAVLLSMMAAGALEGTLLGWFQWRALREKLPGLLAQHWIGITVTVAVLGWFLGMLPSLFIFDEASVQAESAPPIDPDTQPLVFFSLVIAMGLALGAVFGLFQWIVLRQHVRKAIWWIPANALGWALGLCWIYFGASLPEAGSPWWVNAGAGIFGGVAGGLSVGAVTGFFWKKILLQDKL